MLALIAPSDKGAQVSFIVDHRFVDEQGYICQPMCKKWETYGIHALEGMFPLLGEGFVSVQNTGTYERNMVHITHASGCDVHIPLSAGMYGAFANRLLIGSIDSTLIPRRAS